MRGCHQGWSSMGRWARSRLKLFLLMLDSDSATAHRPDPLAPGGGVGMGVAWVSGGRGWGQLCFIWHPRASLLSQRQLGDQGEPLSHSRRLSLPASPLSPACDYSWLPGALDEGDPSPCPSAPNPPTPGEGLSGLQSLLSKSLLHSLSAKIPHDQTSPLSRQGGVFSRELRTRRGPCHPEQRATPCCGHGAETPLVSGGCSGPGMEGELESLLTWMESRGVRGGFISFSPVGLCPAGTCALCLSGHQPLQGGWLVAESFLPH